MPRSNKFWLCLALAALLSGCAGLKRIEGERETVNEGGEKTTPQKPGEKPGTKKPDAPKPPDKGNPQERFDAALAQMKDGQLDEAEAAFKGVTEDFPEFSGPYTNLGILYAKSNRDGLALTAFSKAVVLNNSNATAYNWLGMLYRKGNNFVRAEQAYRAALKADANLALAHLNLGLLLDEVLKRPQDALPLYKDYLRLLGKEDLRVLAWIAEIEAAQKKSVAAPAPVKP